MRRRVPDLSRRCPRCLFPPPHCLCREVPRLETRTRVLIVRHAGERPRTTNSARWAALALVRAEVLEHAVPGRPLPPGRIPAAGAAVLFPSPAASPFPDPPPETLVVLDGTWSQARRMLQRLPELRGLPLLSLPAREGARLRRPTVSAGMSTIEAIAAALAALGEEEAAAGLERLHRLAVERGRWLRWGTRAA